MERTALITGANGFIGNALCKGLLRRGYKVVALVTNIETFEFYNHKNVRTFVGVYEDYDSISLQFSDDVDVVFHLAWQGLNGKSAQSDYRKQLTNSVYCGEAFNMALKHNAKKFVLVSTCNILETISIITSDHVDRPIRAANIYGLGKIAAETIIKYLSSCNSTAFNCAYLAMAYGPGNHSLMVPNVAISKLSQGKDVDLIEGNNLYDLIYIDDIVDGLIAIFERGNTNTSYYLGHRYLKTFKEIFTDIAECFDGKSLLHFGTYHAENDLDYSLIDLDSLYKDTGFECSADFAKSVLKTAEWLKKNDYLGIK